MAHLITGYAGIEHIKSADQGSYNAAFFGSGQNVLDIGNQLKANIISNSTVRILDGDILMKGRHIRVEGFEDLTIETGSAGTSRIDLIVMTYNKDTNTGIETAYLEVIKGNETTGTASEPSYIEGDILGGANKNQMPLYAVRINGVSLASVTKKFGTLLSFQDMAEYYAAQFAKAIDDNVKALSILDTMAKVNANTQANHIPGALALKEFYTNLVTNGSVKAKTATSADAVAWANVSGKPSTYTPSSHTHDDRYYTESEVNSLLNSKYIVEKKTYTSTDRIAHGESWLIKINVAKSGYTPLGIVGVSPVDNTIVETFDLSGTTANITLHSNVPAALPAPTTSCIVSILYRKN